jgi:hypothetical protein
VQLTWVRLQHIMAMSNDKWTIDDTLKNSTVEKLGGCVKFVSEKSQQRKTETRMSRSCSWMNQSDCHDFRVYFGEFAFFSLEKILQGLESHEVRVKETIDDVILRNTVEKKNQH